MIASIIVASMTPASASADLVGDKKAQAAVLARQINAQGRQVEILAEQYNGAQLHASQVEQQLADAEVHLASAQATAEHDRAVLGHEAVIAYMHGGFMATPKPASLTGSVDLAVEQGYFQLATTSQVDALDRMRLAEQQLRQRQAALQSARQEARAALANAASHRQAVQHAAAASQATLNSVQGQLVGLVAQQQDALAAQQLADGKSRLQTVLAHQEGQSASLAQIVPQAAGAAPPQAAAGPSSGPAQAGPAGAAAAATPPTKPPATGGPVLSTPSPPTPAPAPPPTTAPPRPAPPPAPPPSQGAAAAVNYARAQLGKPYLWGAAGPLSFDCSGLTMMAWAAGGVQLSHFAASQYASTAHVAVANLQPGDLVFFGSSLYHVGIYVGGGQMIDAPNSSGVVRYDSIAWPDLQPYGGRP